jgi:hypothetical protein
VLIREGVAAVTATPHISTCDSRSEDDNTIPTIRHLIRQWLGWFFFCLKEAAMPTNFTFFLWSEENPTWAQICVQEYMRYLLVMNLSPELMTGCKILAVEV